ncbi:MAG: hypothetical protein ABWY28_18540 [Pseudomonas prosekii]
MAKQSINLGAAPTGIGGDTPRSAFTKANANFDELYLRDSQLGTAANANIGQAEGNVLGVGNLGLGIKNTPMSNSMNNWTTGFYAIQQGNTQYVEATGISSGNLIAIGFPFGQWGSQIYMGYGTNGRSIIGFRTADFTSAPFMEIYHTGNTTRAADGTLKAI